MHICHVISRIRISSCGIVDVITYAAAVPPEVNLMQHQQDDLMALGRLMMALATLNLAAANNATKSLDTMGKLYGPDIKNAVWWLVGNKVHAGTKVSLTNVGTAGSCWLSDYDCRPLIMCSS